MLNFPFELGPFRRVFLLSLLTGLAIGFPIGKSLQIPAIDSTATTVAQPVYLQPMNCETDEQVQLMNLGARWAHEELECPFFTEGDKFHPAHVGTMTNSAIKQFKNYFGEIGLGKNQTRIYAVSASATTSPESKTGYLLNVVLNAPESEIPSYQARFEIRIEKHENRLMITDLKAKRDYKVSLEKFIKLAHKKALGHMNEKAIRLLVETSFFWTSIDLAKLDLATEISPDFALAHIKKSRIHEMDGKYQSALSDLNEVVRILPAYANARIARAIVKMHLGNFDKAISDLNAAIKLAPNSDCAYFYRGRAFFEQNKFDQALADFSKAEELNPAEPAYPGEVGEVLFNKKQFKAAIAKFDKCLLAKGNTMGFGIETDSCEVYVPAFFSFADRCIHFDRGLAYHWLGEKAKAKQDYELVLRSNYGWKSKLDAVSGIARLRKGEDNPSRIVADFDKASKAYRNCDYYEKVRQLLVKDLSRKG